ncbi:hypothetical protein FRB90_003572 [Tulasnella sp. 427]|nr:hypothetical protein FRB90_003572 [Tulasnella sp. 427]
MEADSGYIAHQDPLNEQVKQSTSQKEGSAAHHKHSDFNSSGCRVIILGRRYRFQDTASEGRGRNEGLGGNASRKRGRDEKDSDAASSEMNKSEMLDVPDTLKVSSSMIGKL